MLKRLQEDKAFFVDCRGAYNYGKGHIPTAKLITHKNPAPGHDASLKKSGTSRLPKIKDTVIIFYSHGSTGWKSYKSAKEAIAAGYSHVLWFRGGLKEWIDAGYSVEY